jgi:hypothetical protein
MALTIVEDTRAVTGGVDTHADMHVAAALDPIGGLLGVEEFPATTAGYARLLGWLGGFGTVGLSYIAKPGSALRLLAVFTRTGHPLSGPGEGCEVQDQVASDLARSRFRLRVATAIWLSGDGECRLCPRCAARRPGPLMPGCRRRAGLVSSRPIASCGLKRLAGTPR